jgi:hypothetical protein
MSRRQILVFWLALPASCSATADARIKLKRLYPAAKEQNAT